MVLSPVSSLYFCGCKTPSQVRPFKHEAKRQAFGLNVSPILVDLFQHGQAPFRLLSDGTIQFICPLLRECFFILFDDFEEVKSRGIE